jgi:ABC-2 type transport system permease protein
MRAIAPFIDAFLATARKDVLAYLRQWKTIVTSLVMPGTYILVALLGSIAVGRNPVALVVQDRAPIAEQVARAIVASDVFRVSRVSANEAQALYDQLAVGAILTIPPGFSQAVENHQSAPILVVANNLNLDFMNDVRRSVPDAITVYYGGLANSPLTITVAQHNLRPRDVDLFQYEVVPLITLLVTVVGLIASSSGTAREFETLSIKEIMLAPTRRIAIVLGKVAASWVATCCTGLIMFAAGYALGWTRPEGAFVLTTLLAIALVALFAATAGIALGCVLRRVQSVNVLSTTGSVWLFFLAGGLGIIQFEPVLLRQVAALDPLTYGTHMLQMAIFYSSFDRLTLDVLVLVGASAALFAVSLAAMRPGLLLVKQARTKGRFGSPVSVKGGGA